LFIIEPDVIEGIERDEHMISAKDNFFGAGKVKKVTSMRKRINSTRIFFG
jgi:hypothetical protein